MTDPAFSLASWNVRSLRGTRGGPRVRRVLEPDDGVELGVLEDALAERALDVPIMRPGLPEPFLAAAGRGFRSECGYFEAADLPEALARLGDPPAPADDQEAEEWSLAAYAAWLRAAAGSRRGVVFLWS